MKELYWLAMASVFVGACSREPPEPPPPPAEYGVVPAPPNALGAYSPLARPLPSAIEWSGPGLDDSEEDAEEEPLPSPQTAPEEGVPL